MVAVQVALKNKMELSLAVSLGSSLQIALFVAPVLVFISLLFNNRLLLVFNDFELIVAVRRVADRRADRAGRRVELAGRGDAAGGLPDRGAGVLLPARRTSRSV